MTNNYFFSKRLSSVMCVLSTMTREWFEIGSVYSRLSLGSHLSRFSLASLICLCMLTVGVGNAWGAEVTAYTLDGTTRGGKSEYTTQTITQSSITWSVQGNTNISPWQIGVSKGSGKGTADFPIYSQTAITEDISKIVLTHGKISLATINSVTIQVYSTAAKAAAGGNGDVSANVTSDDSWKASGTMSFNRPGGANWAGRFYRIVYNITYSPTSGRWGQPAYMEFSSAVFKYDDTPPCTPLGSVNGSILGSN